MPCLVVDCQSLARGVPSYWIDKTKAALKKIPIQEHVETILEELVYHAQVYEEN